MKHVFAVCAYGESPYLKDCLASLKAQSVPSEILLCTATPSPALEQLAAEEGIAYCVNPAAPSIATDWDFALLEGQRAGAEAVTLCHQDDLYLPTYGEGLRRATAGRSDWQIYFSDYAEQRGGVRAEKTRNLAIKRALLWPLRLRRLQGVRWVKHRCLSLGDPICCPAVTYHLPMLTLPLFERELNCSLDWQTWERLARQRGQFVYDPAVRMLHRIHPGSTTTKVLKDGGRRGQDLYMFRKFWPEGVARLLARAYAASENSNDL